MSEAISPRAHDDSLLPPLSAEQSHTGHPGLTDVESEQENPSRKHMPMKERKDRHCILVSPSLPTQAEQRLPVLLLLEEAHGRIWHTTGS